MGNQKHIAIKSQSPLRYTALDAWTTENGLPHNGILDMRQTRDGYIWFGSFNGAARFDGKNFLLLRRSNTPLFGSNTISTLWEDMRGNVWFGVQEGGTVVQAPDGSMTRLDSTYTFKDKMIRAWSENRMKSSPEYGTVYFSANKGIYAISHDAARKTFTLRRDSIYNLDTPEISQDILCDSHAGMWLGTRLGLYYRPSRQNANDVRRFDTTNGLPNISVQCLYEDRSGTVWIGTRRGVCRFTNGRIVQDSALLINTPVHDILEDRDGNIWFGSDNGAFLWTKSTHTPQLSPQLSPQLYRLSTEDGLTDNSVRTLTEDSEGNIWFGTYYGGLNRLKRGIFSNITTREGLINPIVYASLQARDGAMWVATFNGVQRILPDKTINYTTHNGLVTALARALAQDSAGNVWVGTYGALHCIAPEGKVKAYTMRDGLLDDQIRALCAMRDGSLWIGTVNGMSILNNGVFTSLTVQKGDLVSNSILGIMQDRAGNVWVSSNGGGVVIFHANGTKSFLQADRDLPSSDAFCVAESPTSDEIWIPCNGGLTLWKQGKTTIFTIHDGLPDENVFHVLEDSAGMLWMTCNIGIFSVSKHDLMRVAADRRQKCKCTLYTRSDGLQTNSCTVPSFATRTREGEMWIPMLKGVAIINPSKQLQNEVLPSVYCQTVRADTMTQTITSVHRTIAITAGTERVEIRYTALSFTAPELIEFRFMLEGVDKHWVSAGTHRTAYYTNLAPGRYTFRVIAANNSGKWNTTGDIITLDVEAFFYQTRWFIALALVVFLALCLMIVRVRTWRLKARAEILEKTVQERTQQLEEHSEEIEHQNHEIKRQLEILDQQAREIELANSSLNEKNLHLQQANTTLENANAEIYRQQYILEEQAADIELANSELQERNAQLYNLNQEKNEFLGIATHDLKNPLAAIRMTVSLVQRYYDRMSKEDVLDRLGAVEISVERMTSIITNLLDINAIESGKLNVNLQYINTLDLAKQMVEEYRERAKAKNLTLYFSSATERTIAYADRNIVIEVLDNLVSNAVKYSPHDRNIFVSIRDSVREEMHEENTATPDISYLRIDVKDEGPGLSDDDKSKLFGKFMRLSARPTGGEHSTGLGLSIVKRMVEAMNGRVWCESELGKGAMFSVELPCAEREEKT